MILCIDLDNTLNNLQDAVIERFNERYSTNYTIDNFRDYNIENDISIDNAILMKEMYIEQGIYNYVKPLRGAQKFIQKLISNGHQVYIVTDSDPRIFDEKSKWIHTYFPAIDDAHIIAAKHKWMLRCDVMVEDCIDNLLGKPYYDRIVIDCPWNRDVHDYAYDIHRCYNFGQAMDVINKLNELE